jgi:hypothetical protein
MGQFWAVAAADSRPSGALPMKSPFTVSRTGETGVLWGRFQDQKGNSGLDPRKSKGLQFDKLRPQENFEGAQRQKEVV